MGISTTADTVPFVIHGAYFCDHEDKPDWRIMAMLGNELNDIYADLDLEDGELPEDITTINGWTVKPFTKEGKHGRLYAHVLSKVFDNSDYPREVFLVNESTYSDLGEYDVAICSGDDDNIEYFMWDFKDLFPKEFADSEVEINDAVMETE